MILVHFNPAPSIRQQPAPDTQLQINLLQAVQDRMIWYGMSKAEAIAVVSRGNDAASLVLSQLFPEVPLPLTNLPTHLKIA